MNAHDQNSVFRALKAAIEQPSEFTAKLSFAEQDVLHKTDPDKYWRYVDWVFAFNAPVTKRWALKELGKRDLDKEREIESGDNYDRSRRQSGRGGEVES